MSDIVNDLRILYRQEGDEAHKRAADEIVRLRKQLLEVDERGFNRWALGEFIDAVERVAFDMPPPNVYTPRLVQLCVEARCHIHKRRDPVAWGNFKDDGTLVGLSEHPEDTERWAGKRPLYL